MMNTAFSSTCMTNIRMSTLKYGSCEMFLIRCIFGDFTHFARKKCKDETWKSLVIGFS